MKRRLVIIVYSEAALLHVDRIYRTLIEEFDVYLYDLNYSLSNVNYPKVVHGGLTDVVKKYSPKIILTFDCYTYLDKAIAMLAKRKSIALVYLSHGLLTNLDVGNRESLKSGLAKFDIKRLKRLVVPVSSFLYEALRSGLLRSALASIVNYRKDPIAESFAGHYTPFFEDVWALMYCDRDRDFLIEQRRFPEKRVNVIGNPDLFELEKLNGRIEKVLFIDDGLVDSGIVDEGTWLNQIIKLNEHLRLENRLLKIRLHPRSKKLANALIELKIDVSIAQETSLVEDLRQASVVLGFYSSVLSICLFNGIRVVRPDFMFSNVEIPTHQLDSIIIKAQNLKHLLDKRMEGSMDKKVMRYFTGYKVNNFDEEVLKQIKACEYL